MNDSFNAKDFLEDYNLLLSRASLEKKDNFSSLASPTLNKQETVTFLYLKVQKYLKTKKKLYGGGPFVKITSDLFTTLYKFEGPQSCGTCVLNQ